MKKIFHRIQRDAQNLLNKGALNTETLTCTWRELAPGAVVPSPLFASHSTPTDYIDRTETFKGFVHDLENAGTRTHFFKEFKAGDIIIDYPASYGNFEGKENIRFLYRGVDYVPKVVGKEVAESWDASSNGVGMRTLLLTRLGKSPETT